MPQHIISVSHPATHKCYIPAKQFSYHISLFHILVSLPKILLALFLYEENLYLPFRRQLKWHLLSEALLPFPVNIQF